MCRMVYSRGIDTTLGRRRCERQLTPSRRGVLVLCGAVMAAGLIAHILTPPAKALGDPVGVTQETLDSLSDIQSRYTQAQETLSRLGEQLESLARQQEETQAHVDETQAQIEDTQAQIDQRQAEVEAAQGDLATSVVTSYKSGSISFLDLAVGATSIDDLISSIYYTNKINQSENEKIGRIKALRDQLEQTKSALEGQKASLRDLQGVLAQQTSDAQEKQAETQAILDGLDQEIRDLIATHSAEIQASYQEELRAMTEAVEAAGPADAPTRVALCSAALSLLGVPYVWGGSYPDSGGTDCSGLMQWSYARCGFSIPRTTHTQLDACNVVGRLHHDVSRLLPGDLVFVNGGGHVGMYLGNGRIVHAPQPGGVIMVSGLDRWSSIYAIGYPIVDDGHTPNDEGQQGEEDGEM